MVKASSQASSSKVTLDGTLVRRSKAVPQVPILKSSHREDNEGKGLPGETSLVEFALDLVRYGLLRGHQNDADIKLFAGNARTG